MELKEFIKEVLTQIIDGVDEAQRDVKTRNEGIVNPDLTLYAHDQTQHGRLTSSKKELVQSVKFDVALTVSEGKGTKAGIGVYMGAISLGAGGKSDESTSTVSRIQFEVPVLLPRKVRRAYEQTQ